MPDHCSLAVACLALLQGLPQGKLYRIDPVTREVHLLAKGFWYSNGIAVSQDDSFVVISETDRLRLIRHWVKGPKVRRHFKCAIAPAKGEGLQTCTAAICQGLPKIDMQQW